MRASLTGSVLLWDYTIGLFGGKDIRGVVLVDACSGATEYMDIEDAPTWIDQAYSSDIVVQQIDYWGKYRNGFFNTIFGQKDVVVTSGGYNYLALEDDVWLYTGLTSAGNDASNIGFVLVNMRTKGSQGTIQCPGPQSIRHVLGGRTGAASILCINLPYPVKHWHQPTYFVSLKDMPGL